jgi:tetratricopeptide (TPR) repeat protein
MRTGLATAFWLRVRDLSEENDERLCAANNLAHTFLLQGKYAEAEQVQREVYAVRRRVFGAEHPTTLEAANNLAEALSGQDKSAEAEQMQREVLDAKRRVFGEEHAETLGSANNLATALSKRGQHAKAEQILREVCAAVRQTLGAEHPKSLMAAYNLAASIAEQEKAKQEWHDERLLAASIADQEIAKQEWHDATVKAKQGVQMLREVLVVQQRVLGAEHPDTLRSTQYLAETLIAFHKFAEAEELFQQALANSRSMLGSEHPDTLERAERLRDVRRLRAKQESRAKGAAKIRTRCALLPAGTRVLVQHLVAKPEYNGKVASVLSYDRRSEKYTVVLDNGKELLLKAEHVARAGCAAVGCTSQEASSVCGRCQAVRYCSRECQSAHWKAHRPACTASAAKPP